MKIKTQHQYVYDQGQVECDKQSRSLYLSEATSMQTHRNVGLDFPNHTHLFFFLFFHLRDET